MRVTQRIEQAGQELALTQRYENGVSSGLTVFGDISSQASPSEAAVGFSLIDPSEAGVHAAEGEMVKRFQSKGLAGIRELQDLSANGTPTCLTQASAAFETKLQAEAISESAWQSAEQITFPKPQVCLNDAVPISGSAFGELPLEVSVPGAVLPGWSRTLVHFAGHWLVERLLVAQERDPRLVEKLKAIKLDSDFTFRDGGNIYHFVDDRSGNSNEMIAREVLLEGSAQFFRRIEDCVTSADIGNNLKNAILRHLQQRQTYFAKLYAEPDSIGLILPETNSEMVSALKVRQGGVTTRAFWVDPETLRSTREQQEPCGAIVLQAKSLRFESIDTAMNTLTQAGRLPKVDCSLNCRPEPNDAWIAALSLAQQAELFTGLKGHGADLLKPFSPLEIPDWVRPVRVAVVSTAQREIEYDYARSELGYGTTQFRWPGTLFLVEDRPHTLWWEVRFHTKVHDNLGEVYPGFVVTRTVSGLGADGKQTRWGEVLTNLRSSDSAVDELVQAGAKLVRYSDGSVWQNIDQKRNLQGVIEAFNAAKAKGEFETCLKLKDEADLARRINTHIHHDHLPHRVNGAAEWAEREFWPRREAAERRTA